MWRRTERRLQRPGKNESKQKRSSPPPPFNRETSNGVRFGLRYAAGATYAALCTEETILLSMEFDSSIPIAMDADSGSRSAAHSRSPRTHRARLSLEIGRRVGFDVCTEPVPRRAAQPSEIGRPRICLVSPIRQRGIQRNRFSLPIAIHKRETIRN